VSTTALSLDDFLRLPEQEPALELDPNGTISLKMSPNTQHSALQARLAYLLEKYREEVASRHGARGHVYTKLRINVAGASRLPDVAFYRQSPKVNESKHALEAPDLAIEIMSPSDVPEDQRAKCQWYVAMGTRIALLVDPKHRIIEVFDNDKYDANDARISRPMTMREYFNNDVLPLEVVLPDLRLTVGEIFAALDDEPI
jgi:Uma2 family endonuclease